MIERAISILKYKTENSGTERMSKSKIIHNGRQSEG